MINKSKGFTLIELLVVIAIIGILSSVVLASLNTARGKGADAAIKSNLANARAEAEIFYDSASGSYDGVCATSGNNVIGDNMQAVAAITGGAYAVSDTANVSATVPVCHDSSAGWAAASATKTGTPVAWCVDSTGVSQSAAALTVLDTDNDVTCN
jgi:prepilin-type N-terminal cleavage/methylation domain-containing protein